MSRKIRIGNGAGFWGDWLEAPRLLAEAGALDYLTLEYLAELTMSILAHLKSRDPQAGFVTDLPPVLESLIPSLKQQPGLKIVTNAGGVNPVACARACARVLVKAGLSESLVAVVQGDDLLPRLDELLAAGHDFAHYETDEPLRKRRADVVCANAYLGSEGIVEALQQQARLVITGRVADASLTVGPVLAEFGESWRNWERLGLATAAGHLIECGAQVTGGMYSDWDSSIRLADVGYPIAVLDEAGTLQLTKPPGSGGVVTPQTVAEQLIYEIGDPTAYLTPDVSAGFSHITLTQSGPDCVTVANAGGQSYPDFYKVSLCYRNGWKATGMLVISGRDAERKARESARIIFERVRNAGFTLDHTITEILGSGETYPGSPPNPATPWEVVLKVGVRSASREAVEHFTRELAPLVTSGPPGVSGYTGGRVKPQPVLAYWPTTIPRDVLTPQVQVQSANAWNQ